ncbi:MAG: hypothetical protein M1819_001859 [Sarea resinae]|nr:MAG: hypothetical protein M1819_001859 [Sarea resinae]
MQEDYIKRWLAETGEGGGNRDLEFSHRENGRPPMHRHRHPRAVPRNRDLNIRRGYDCGVKPSQAIGHGRKNQLHPEHPKTSRLGEGPESQATCRAPPPPSLDSSILEAAVRPSNDLEQDPNGSTSSVLLHDDHEVDPKKTRKSSRLSKHSLEMYDKRKRHKTRLNLYQPESGAEKHGPKSRERKKRQSKKERKSKSGSALMHNFAAKNVNKDRITVIPSVALGLFGKGRASSPTKKRGCGSI